MFLDAIIEFKETKSDSQRFQLGAQIVTQFVKVGAQYEINISSDLREECVSQFFKACTTQSCPLALFDQVHQSMLIQLQSEQFPRFLKSPFYDKFKMGQKGVCAGFEDRDAESKSFLYEVTDFSAPNIGEEDFLRVLSLARPNDVMWKPLLKKSDIVTYISKNSFEVEKRKGLRLLKIVSEYNYSASMFQYENHVFMCE